MFGTLQSRRVLGENTCRLKIPSELLEKVCARHKRLCLILVLKNLFYAAAKQWINEIFLVVQGGFGAGCR